MTSQPDALVGALEKISRCYARIQTSSYDAMGETYDHSELVYEGGNPSEIARQALAAHKAQQDAPAGPMKGGEGELAKRIEDGLATLANTPMNLSLAEWGDFSNAVLEACAKLRAPAETVGIPAGLDELRRLSEAATPGPWTTERRELSSLIWGVGANGHLAVVHQFSGQMNPQRAEAIANARQIVAAVNYVRAMLNASPVAPAPVVDREAIARIIDPEGYWAIRLGIATDDQHMDLCHRRDEEREGTRDSLAKADAILALNKGGAA